MIRNTRAGGGAELDWFKSSYSDSSSGNDCIEVAVSPGVVHVRDSKNAQGSFSLRVAARRFLASGLCRPDSRPMWLGPLPARGATARGGRPGTGPRSSGRARPRSGTGRRG
ncbi:DUF397 domain-containing protein [Streptomyces sp. NPDC058385]|uniref:DUF397 domain-containing protein n=1 Tax=Streptomyces sp. NPDC058385 TaxID=3346473 RepID=UPI0036688736